MAQVTVFVDDYVRGALPRVCVVSGASETVRVQHKFATRRLHPAVFFLVLLGPLGWLVLTLVLAFSDRKMVHGHLPMTQSVYEGLETRYRLSRRGLWVAALAVFLAVGLGVLGAGAMIVWVLVAVAVAALLGGGYHALRAEATVPGLNLDGSNRWITMRGVHPAFARSVGERSAAQASRS